MMEEFEVLSLNQSVHPPRWSFWKLVFRASALMKGGNVSALHTLPTTVFFFEDVFHRPLHSYSVVASEVMPEKEASFIETYTELRSGVHTCRASLHLHQGGYADIEHEQFGPIVRPFGRMLPFLPHLDLR